MVNICLGLRMCTGLDLRFSFVVDSLWFGTCESVVRSDHDIVFLKFMCDDYQWCGEQNLTWLGPSVMALTRSLMMEVRPLY